MATTTRDQLIEALTAEAGRNLTRAQFLTAASSACWVVLDAAGIPASLPTLYAILDDSVGLDLVPAGSWQVVADALLTTTAVQSGSLVLNVRDFGATGDGVSDDSAAIQDAVDSLPLTGGIVWFPPGVYACSSPIVLDGLEGTTLAGAGGRGGLAQGASVLVYTAAGAASFLSATDVTGFRMRGLFVTHSSGAYTGVLLDLEGSVSGSTRIHLEDCKFGGAAGVESSTCITLNETHTVKITECEFMFYQTGIVGERAGGYSVGNTISNTYFGRGNVAHIDTGGDGWLVSGCVFANFTDGSGGAWGPHTFNHQVESVEISGCWMGDLTAVGQAQINHNARVLVLSGNTIGVGPNTAVKVTQDNSRGTILIGNRISGNGAGTATFVDWNGHVGQSGVVKLGNSTGGITVDVAGGMPLGTLEQSSIGLSADGLTVRQPSSGSYLTMRDATGVDRVTVDNASADIQLRNTAGVLRTRMAAGIIVSNGGSLLLGTETAHTVALRTNSVDRLIVGSTRAIQVNVNTSFSAGQVLSFAGPTGPSVSGGVGTPEGAVTAPVGSLFMRSDGGVGTSLYLKSSGTGNTGWAGIH